MGTPAASLRFKELGMDTSDGEDLGRFWAEVVGCRFQAGGDGSGDVVGDREYQGIGMGRVPEPKTVKHRVHLDVYGDPTALAELGARIVLPAAESGFRWTVMRDPEGGEFCAFEKDPLPAYRLHGIVVDCADPERIAAWWGDRFGVQPKQGDGWWTLEGVTPDPVLTMDFVPVPEPKTAKNRLHWDVYGDTVATLAAGATHLWDTPRWQVLADPEGNEFCVFPT